MIQWKKNHPFGFPAATSLPTSFFLFLCSLGWGPAKCAVTLCGRRNVGNLNMKHGLAKPPLPCVCREVGIEIKATLGRPELRRHWSTPQWCREYVRANIGTLCWLPPTACSCRHCGPRGLGWALKSGFIEAMSSPGKDCGSHCIDILFRRFFFNCLILQPFSPFQIALPTQWG